MTKENIMTIISKIRNAKELTSEECKGYEEMSLQDWADLLNAGEKVQDLSDAAAKKETEKIKAAKCAEFLSMDKETMFTAFIENPFYMGKRIQLNKKTNAFSVVDVKRQLSFYDLERAYQIQNSTETNEKGEAMPNKTVTIAVNAHYDCLLRMFLDNICRAIADEVKTSAPELTDTVAAHKKEAGMEGFGLAKLEEQLRKVCAAVCPESVLPKMLKVDVKFIEYAATRVKYQSIQVFNEKAMINAIFMAIKTRKEGGKYEMISRAACHRVKKEG